MMHVRHAVLVMCLAVGWACPAFAQQSRILEEQEKTLDTLREYCGAILYRRRNAERNEAWRELVNTSKSYADACSGIEDRFLIAKAYEDMAYALLMLNDIQQALRWAQSCLDGNPMAVGCAARKAEILWMIGRTWEARAAISRGMMAGERAVGMTRVEIERVRMNKPDPRSDSIYRTRYLRKMEMLDIRLSTLEDGLRLMRNLQDGVDYASGY